VKGGSVLDRFRIDGRTVHPPNVCFTDSVHSLRGTPPPPPPPHTHRWVAARGDWSDPLQQQRATEAVQLFADFFRKHL
jgi:hypothetical protein